MHEIFGHALKNLGTERIDIQLETTTADHLKLREQTNYRYS